MRILFDTNVWIAAFLTHGACHELLEHCLENHHLLISEEILKETEEHLKGKFKFPPLRVKEVLAFIQNQTHLVEIQALTEPVCRDPKDDPILAAVVSGKADCLISGDKDLLVLKEFLGCPILSPAQFWKFEKEH